MALIATTLIAAMCFFTNVFSPEVVYIWLLNLSGMCGFVFGWHCDQPLSLS